MPDPTHSVAALIMVRNERHIVATCIGHLLHTVRVDRVYVVDNGSTDGTLQLLQRMAQKTKRLIVDVDQGPYRHGEIVTALAHRARVEGATWVLPTDADEFMWLRPGTSLSDLINRDDVGGYQVAVRNFMQARFVRRDGPGSLATMWVAAVPVGVGFEGQARVSSGEVPFIRVAYPTKVLLRTAPSLSITFGNHDASGTAGPLVPLVGGEILHAPMRSFERLHRRAEAGRRAEVVTPNPGHNWHLKRVTAMDATGLEQEWRQNSFSPLQPIRSGATRLDLRLARVGWQQGGFRRSIERG